MRTVIFYSLFAGIAMLINLATQATVVHWYAGAYAIPLSVLAGTISGVSVKYVLDKNYIFRKSYSRIDRHIRSASLYLVASVATTLIFWGVEAAFHFAFGSAEMRYLGGAIGLTLGYILKFHLDKKFAFGGDS
ncbi:MAG: GtrA family protein [Luteimonas sp.]